MKMNRRDFVMAGTAAALGHALTPILRSSAKAETASEWRTFEVMTTVKLCPEDRGATVWIPIAAHRDEGWIVPSETRWNGNTDHALILQSGPYDARFLRATWSETETAPWIQVVDQVRTRRRSLADAKSASLSPSERQLYTAPGRLVPTDGIVRETARTIVAQAGSDFDKVRAIYEWVVENTYRDPSVAGCGTGDIVSMLRTGRRGGKCADINALFVGLVRSLDIPARDIYGVRTAASPSGYKSLGIEAGVATKAQHCRAEVFITDAGWIAVDPADVRKIILEEPPGTLTLADATVQTARSALFGGWDENWIAYNTAHDVALPGASGPSVDFLMYPQAEVAGTRLDCLDLARFRYEITSREVVA